MIVAWMNALPSLRGGHPRHAGSGDCELAPANMKPDVGSAEPDAGSTKLEAGSSKREAGIWVPGAGSRTAPTWPRTGIDAASDKPSVLTRIRREGDTKPIEHGSCRPVTFLFHAISEIFRTQQLQPGRVDHRI